jgi:hypothetical protein
VRRFRSDPRLKVLNFHKRGGSGDDSGVKCEFSLTLQALNTPLKLGCVLFSFLAPHPKTATGQKMDARVIMRKQLLEIFEMIFH